MGLIKTLQDTEPFNRLPEEVFAQLSQAASQKTYPPHTHIFKQNDPPTGYLYVIKTGQVEIFALTPGGGEMVVDHRQDGSFFGGTPVFSNEPYTAGARTVKKTECFLIPAELLLDMAKQYPHISEHFTQAICSRMRSLYAEMVSNHSQKALTQMESYPFKKRLADIMSEPVGTCAPETPIKEVARRMTERGGGSILVCNPNRRPVGIISERDLVTKVLARENLDPKAAQAAQIMTPDPFTMTPETYMYEATSFMIGHKISQMPVMDKGEVVGVVTLQDLMRYRSQKSMLLISNIQQATTIEELKAIKGKMVKVARALLSEMRSHAETMEILSYIHHSIQRRAFEMVLQEQKQQGMNPPEVRFCFIIMGSGGRKEMLLGPDQDNGFLFENFPDERLNEVNAFFIPLAEKLVETLDRIGYPRCMGKVMVNNPLWRGRLKDWYSRIYDWFNAPEPQRVRYSTIFFDFMPLVGDAALCQDLRDIVHQLVKKFPLFLYHMMELDFKHKVPLGLLGRFTLDKEHKGRLSVKQTGSIFIVDCVRMFMLEKQIFATTTNERIDRLANLNIFNQDTAEHLKAAFEAFTYLRLRNEIDLAATGSPPSHYLDPYALSKNEQDLLREAFRAASKLQDSTRHHFKVG